MPGPGGRGGGPGGGRGPGGMGGHGGMGHRPPPPPRPYYGGRMWRRPYRGGCLGCLLPVLGIAAVIATSIVLLLF